MKLSQYERDALVAWMQAKNLTQQEVGNKLKVTHVSVMKWLKGGGIHAPQRAILIPLVTPYMKAHDMSQPELELKTLRSKLERHVDTHPDLVIMHLAVLDQLESFLARHGKSELRN